MWSPCLAWCPALYLACRHSINHEVEEVCMYGDHLLFERIHPELSHHQSAWRHGLPNPWLSSLNLWPLIKEPEWRPGALLSLARDGSCELETVLRHNDLYQEKRPRLGLLLINSFYWCWTLYKTLRRAFKISKYYIYTLRKQNKVLLRKYNLSKWKEMQFETSYHFTLSNWQRLKRT